MNLQRSWPHASECMWRGDKLVMHIWRILDVFFWQNGITGVNINAISKTLVLACAFERPQFRQILVNHISVNTIGSLSLIIGTTNIFETVYFFILIYLDRALNQSRDKAIRLLSRGSLVSCRWKAYSSLRLIQLPKSKHIFCWISIPKDRIQVEKRRKKNEISRRCRQWWQRNVTRRVCTSRVVGFSP